MPPLPVSTLFVGLFALLRFPMTIMVGYRRAQTEIPFLDGGSRLLAGRLLHAYWTVVHAWGVPRAFAMVLTFVPMLGFGGWTFYRGLV